MRGDLLLNLAGANCLVLAPPASLPDGADLATRVLDHVPAQFGYLGRANPHSTDRASRCPLAISKQYSPQVTTVTIFSFLR
jgi:hypothetical protein